MPVCSDNASPASINSSLVEAGLVPEAKPVLKAHLITINDQQDRINASVNHLRTIMERAGLLSSEPPANLPDQRDVMTEANAFQLAQGAAGALCHNANEIAHLLDTLERELT